MAYVHSTTMMVKTPLIFSLRNEDVVPLSIYDTVLNSQQQKWQPT
jgi:hypothetical protein